MIHPLSAITTVFLACSVWLAACSGTAQPPAALPRTTDGAALIAVESRILDTSRATDTPQVGDLAPDFQFSFADGTQMKLSGLRGKKVILNFWATWCGPCREEMPDLQRALQSGGDQLAVIGVNKVEQVDAITSFANELKLTFPLVANPRGDIPDRYRVTGLPVSYFINRDGTIGARQIGVMNFDTIQQKLGQLQ
jgi:peroxiredoxin